MAVSFAQINTLGKAQNYAKAGMAASKKSCSKATATYAKALNQATAGYAKVDAMLDSETTTVKQAETVEANLLVSIKALIKKANTICTAQRKAAAGGAAVKDTDAALGPLVPSTGPLAFMNKLPGPKWAWFAGAGVLALALVFPKETKKILPF